MRAHGGRMEKERLPSSCFCPLLLVLVSAIFSRMSWLNDRRKDGLDSKNATQTLVVLANAKKKPGNVPSASLDLLGFPSENPARRRILTSINTDGENPTPISS